MAVSGGVDSVVLLDMLVRRGDARLIVAHVDHGIRKDSADDARFVEALAANYGLLYISTRLSLGKNASENEARQARYDFLTKEAKRFKATIMTAHHLDDVVESVVINLIRGTGWRGLAVMNRSGIERPLLDIPKSDLYDYALENNLEWVEDSTNAEYNYLRNQVRLVTKKLPMKTKQDIYRLRQQQINLKLEIEGECQKMIGKNAQSRYLFAMAEEKVGRELLRSVIDRQSLPTPTSPQLEKALVAIKTSRPGKVHQIGAGVNLSFSSRTFIVSTSER